jgi:multidrug efflux pump subunit AcrB
VYGEHGRVVRVSDVATVHKGIAQPSTELALIDGRVGIAVGARMDGSRRVDQWTVVAEDAVADFGGTLPRGVELVEVFRQSGYTDARFGDLMSNLLLGALMVVGVIWLMMGWRSAIVVGAALPLTSLMVLAGMAVLGVPMHQFSITGLIIALGLLIDNAIVMVDEVNHRRSEGLAPLAAIRRSVGALAVPLLGSTFTTALAFLPLLLMPGGAGEFVGALSVSVILAIGSSLFLALTVLPALTVRLGGGGGQQPARWWRNGFRLPALTRLHRASLGFLLRRPVLGVALALLLPVVGFTQAGNLVEQFFPAAGRDQFSVELRMPVEAPLARTEQTLRAARAALLENDEIERVHWFAGNSAPRVYYNQMGGEDDSAYFAQAIVQLRSADGAAAVIRDAQAQLNARLPEAQFLVRQFEQGPPFAAPIELRIYGPDLDRLDELGQQARRILSEVPGVEHTRTSLVHGRPKLVVRMDQEEANRSGFTNVDVARQLDADLEGAHGGSFLEATEELPVRVRVRDADRADVAGVASLELRSETGGERPRWTPLSAFAELELEPELAVVPRRNGSRVNTVLGFTTAGTLPEVARVEFERRLVSGEFTLPPGYRTEFGGETGERDTAVGNMLAPVALLGVLMAGTLVLAFNSFRLASIIGGVAALSMGLSLGALWFWGYPFGFMAIVGTMGLLGVAINDAIVVLAAIRDDAVAATGDAAAVRDVVVRSTRHVLATTVTTIAGFTPLMLAGGEFWPPLAVAIAGGVAGATVLALYFVPSAFLILSRGRLCGAPVSAA